MKITFFGMYKFLFFLTIIFILSSCSTKKKLVYFQSPENTSISDTGKNYTPIFHTDDLLLITVAALDIDAVKPFNLPVVTSNPIDGKAIGTPTQQGYLIDANGMIDFPVLGKIKIAGLNRMEATNLFKTKLSEYVSNAIVNIRILNFKITVIGEVKNPGSYTIPNERITLPEALGLAGDMNITGVRNNVLVIRDIDGKKTQTRVDMTLKTVFNSPVYYLSQNDVVYVEPNRAKINSSVINSANAGIFISIASLIITTIALITR